MTKQMPEKRHYPRVIFYNPSKNAALISLLDANEPGKVISSSILNISEGGLQLSLKRTSIKEIKAGMVIMLNHIKGLHELSSLADISMQVIWVMDNEYLEHILIGTAFDALSDNHRQTLRSFIETCLREKMKEKC